jgi:hypothetical protein
MPETKGVPLEELEAKLVKGKLTLPVNLAMSSK